MAATNAGKVSMNLVLNSKEFQTQLNKSVNDSIRSTSASASNTVKNAFSGLGKIAAAAFSVKAVTNFTQSCLELGSTLQEVQNVVDVTFGSMSSDADKFAQSAIKDFGLSETVAKQYMGTFGAMSKSFGYSTKDALELSKSLTGLVGDVSSFYNLDSSEAYTKLKSVFTGETESLKDLGVVMTQTALDNYALANGFGKTTKQMTEQEKVALRYQFVLDKLSAASGDFIRTQDGWANQTRVLSLQWDSFKANLGQGLISALTPVIKVINELMAKLVQLSSVFKSTMEGIFGKQDSGSISSISSEMAGLAGNTEGVGTAAEDAAKKIKRSLLSFDKLNILTDNNSSESADTGTSSIEMTDSTETVSQIENATQSINPLIDRLKELKSLFSEGFKEGLGTSSLEETKEHIAGIKDQLSNIFNDPSVQSAGKRLADSIVLNLGKVSGSVGSIGITIAENLTGGIEENLKEKSPRIKEWIVKMFDIGSEMSTITGDFSVAVADIFSVFRSDSAKSLTSNIIGSFEEIGMFISNFGATFGLELEKSVTQPITDNSEKIKIALGGLVDWLNERWGTVNTALAEFGDKFDEIYNEKLAPNFQRINDVVSGICGTFLDMWNNNLQPILDKAGIIFDQLVSEHLSPLGDAFWEFFGTVSELVATIYEIAKPIVDWVINTVGPIIGDVVYGLYEIIASNVAAISDIIRGFLEILSGVITFITGVLSGDWEMAWNGIKDIFGGIIDAIVGIFKSGCGTIKGLADALWGAVKGVINGIIDGINNLTGKISGAKIGNMSIGIDIPKIPHLAQGTYVKANAPQLAVIGDNKKEGEIVAPESKIREQVVIAMQPLLAAIQQLIAVIQSGGSSGAGEVVIPIYFANELLDTYIINLQNRQVVRTGGR